MSTPAAPPPLRVRALLWNIINGPHRGAWRATGSGDEAEAVALGLAVTDGICVWVAQHVDVPFARPDICPARPWPSCSRPDGQTLRHWVSKPWWTNEGEACS